MVPIIYVGSHHHRLGKANYGLRKGGSLFTHWQIAQSVSGAPGRLLFPNPSYRFLPPLRPRSPTGEKGYKGDVTSSLGMLAHTPPHQDRKPVFMTEVPLLEAAANPFASMTPVYGHRRYHGGLSTRFRCFLSQTWLMRYGVILLIAPNNIPSLKYVLRRTHEIMLGQSPAAC